jgi:nucleoid-associated protein YgaU
MFEDSQSWKDVEERLIPTDEKSAFNAESFEKMSNIIKLTLSSSGAENPLEKLDLAGVLDMTRASAAKLRENKVLLEERELKTQEFIRRTTAELHAAQQRIAEAEARIAAAEAREGMAEARVVSAESWVIHIHDTLSESFACG